MGKIFKFHTDVDTDQIIASQYLLFPTIDEMKTHTFESLDPVIMWLLLKISAAVLPENRLPAY